MRRSSIAVACALAGATVWAPDVVVMADETAEPPRHDYCSPGGELDYLVVTAPHPHAMLGTVALAHVERVRGDTSPMPSVLGEAPANTPPAGWPAQPLADLPGVVRGKGVLAARSGEDGECECDTVIADIESQRVAVLYATRTFQVGREVDDIQVLNVRALYRDGIVVYINGREVVRRQVDPDGGVMDVVKYPHGPEWETFHVPVVPGLLVEGENLLAVEVRPSGRRAAPMLDIALSAADAGRIIRGPMVQRVGPTSATVVFETDLPTSAAVEYGATADRGEVVQSAGGGLAVRHVVELENLPAHGSVHYRVVAGSHITEDFVFHTARKRRKPIRFTVYGDVRGGHDIHATIVEQMLSEAPDFVLVTGDMVLRGTDEADWQKFFEVTRGLLSRIPYYPAAGNHDMGRAGDEERRMNEIFDLWPGPEDRPTWGHWYSFDVADIHFIMLDSNSYEHKEQLEWLKKDLKAARKSRAIFAATHDGPYSRGTHRGNAYAVKKYVPLLREYGVDMIFSGHDHLYQRGEVDGLAYIVSGGGGASLYSPRCGWRKKPDCTVDGVQTIAKQHHYVSVAVYRKHMTVCAKQKDGTPLEECVKYDL